MEKYFRMKILQIIDSLSTGGAEKLIVDTVPLYVQKGFKTDVLLLNGNVTPFYKELLEKKCTNIFSLGNSFYNPLYIFKIIPYLRKYDVVHVHLFPAQYFVVLAKILSFSKVKLVFTEHNTSNRRLENKAYSWIEILIYYYYKKVICITSEVKSVLVNKLNLSDIKLKIIENGVNLNLIKVQKEANRNNFNFESDDKLLIMVAGFRLQKDQDTIIKSLKFLPENYKLLLVGDGERREILEKLVNDLELNERVSFLGVRSDVYALIKMADIAILSSHWEGFGLVAVEAMACGIPLLASDVDGLAQVVKGGGILFEKGNSLELSEKIQLLINNQELYNSTAVKGIHKAKKYDINLMVDKILTLYKSL